MKMTACPLPVDLDRFTKSPGSARSQSGSQTFCPIPAISNASAAEASTATPKPCHLW